MSSEEKQALIDYIYYFAWVYGRYYHVGDAEKIIEQVGQIVELPEKVINEL
jgi:hypothetical protein